jgi:hypothetical protein
MGGGKETPRQKMISMMYIVLTALLALNVSKQILEAYIAIEENIQLANISESDRGNDKFDQIKEKATDKVEKSQKAIEIYKIAQKLDKLTAEQIQLLDEAKIKTLIALQEPQITKLEEDVTIEGKKVKVDVGVITDIRKDITIDGEHPGLKKASVVPIRMNLHNVKGADKYDEGMRIMGIASPGSVKAPAEGDEYYGLKIWNGLNKYRGEIINLVCESATIISKIEADSGKVGMKYSFKDPMLGRKEAKTQFVSPSEIEDLLKNKGALKTVPEKDARFIIDLYASMCKNDFSIDKETQEEFHWIGRTFDHAPGVAVLAAISSLQKEVLKARSEVMIYLQSEIGGSDYSFDKVVGLARPLDPVVAGGQEFFVEIQAAAYDSQREPEVDTEGQGQVVSIKNGVALVKFRAPSSGEMNIKGSVFVKKKTGTPVKLPYSTQVVVAPKSGSLELPEFNVLYRQYDNIIIPSASGSIDQNLSAPGCTVSRTTYNGRKGFKVRPNAGQNVKIGLTGKDREGKSINYGSWDYKIKSQPDPSITTKKISRSGGTIDVALVGSPLNVTYTILSVKCEDYSGSGKIIPASALAKVRIGKNVAVIAVVKNNKTGGQISVPGVLTVTN